MSLNKTLMSEKYKKQSLDSLDSTYGIVLKNTDFMLDDNLTLVFVDSCSNLKNIHISDEYFFKYKYITERRIQEQVIEPKKPVFGKNSSHIHHSNPISQEISVTHIQSVRKIIQSKISKKYFELDNELLKRSKKSIN